MSDNLKTKRKVFSNLQTIIVEEAEKLQGPRFEKPPFWILRGTKAGVYRFYTLSTITGVAVLFASLIFIRSNHRINSQYPGFLDRIVLKEVYESKQKELTKSMDELSTILPIKYLNLDEKKGESIRKKVEKAELVALYSDDVVKANFP